MCVPSYICAYINIYTHIHMSKNTKIHIEGQMHIQKMQDKHYRESEAAEETRERERERERERWSE
jgi:hypothetical protein